MVGGENCYPEGRGITGGDANFQEWMHTVSKMQDLSRWPKAASREKVSTSMMQKQ